ncbi:hypothetical protein HDU76_013918 [Blyttiomyces sp. JEL0837]|nr:hypothetical protein HDU76_013918 [Blyttiomyces sp. JEL0837]
MAETESSFDIVIAPSTRDIKCWHKQDIKIAPPQVTDINLIEGAQQQQQTCHHHSKSMVTMDACTDRDLLDEEDEEEDSSSHHGDHRDQTFVELEEEEEDPASPNPPAQQQRVCGCKSLYCRMKKAMSVTSTASTTATTTSPSLPVKEVNDTSSVGTTGHHLVITLNKSLQNSHNPSTVTSIVIDHKLPTTTPCSCQCPSCPTTTTSCPTGVSTPTDSVIDLTRTPSETTLNLLSKPSQPPTSTTKTTTTPTALLLPELLITILAFLDSPQDLRSCAETHPSWTPVAIDRLYKIARPVSLRSFRGLTTTLSMYPDRASKLRVLDLSRVRAAAIPSLDLYAFLEAARLARRVVCLDLRRVRGLSDATVIALVTRTVDTLMELRVGGDGLSDDGLGHLARLCGGSMFSSRSDGGGAVDNKGLVVKRPSTAPDQKQEKSSGNNNNSVQRGLRLLELDGCRGVKDSGFGKIVSLAPGLTSLKLASMTGITDEGLKILGRSTFTSQALQCLQLFRDLTNDDIYMLEATCPNLKTVFLKQCRLVSAAFAEEFSRNHKLQVVPKF